MDAKTLARTLALIRLGIGAGLVLAPGVAGRIWVGEHAEGPGARVFARAIGARDLLLGARALASQGRGEPLKEWMRYEAFVDAADTLATVLAARNLTPGRRILMPLISGAYTVVTLKVVSELES